MWHSSLILQNRGFFSCKHNKWCRECKGKLALTLLKNSNWRTCARRSRHRNIVHLCLIKIPTYACLQPGTSIYCIQCSHRISPSLSLSPAAVAPFIRCVAQSSSPFPDLETGSREPLSRPLMAWATRLLKSFFFPVPWSWSSDGLCLESDE